MEIKNFDTINEIEELDWTVDKEILLLYSLHGHKPVGVSKNFQMILIQDRLSSAMNKPISTKAIWKKLNMLYDLEALDEADAEADAANSVTIDFFLPEDDYGEMIKDKINGKLIKIEKIDSEFENKSDKSQTVKVGVEIKSEPEKTPANVEMEDSSESQKGTGKDSKKEIVKRGPKKKETTLVKENILKKDTIKETSKKDLTNSKDTVKDSKRGASKEDKKDEMPKKTTQDNKKDIKEEKKEPVTKMSKRDSADKKVLDQNKKEIESKKSDQKKISDTGTSKPQRESMRPRSETPKQLKLETPKRNEAKPTRSETPKNQTGPKPTRVEALKKDASSDKKKEVEKKGEKSPEKTSDSGRGSKLRNREKKEEPETSISGAKRERSRDSNSKVDTQEEPLTKRAKTPVIAKGRPTRNSIEPQQKPASPVVNPNSPQKRRTRLN